MGRRALGSVLVTVLVVLSVVATGVGTVGAQDGAGEAGANDTDDGLPPADEIYVEGNGDAVLVYENNTDDTDLRRANYGLDIGEGLFHALVVTDLEGSRDVAGNATATLTGERFAGNGSLSMPRPESVADLAVNVTGERTSETARSDATASMTIADPNVTRTLPVASMRTSGNLTTTADRFDAAAEAHAELQQPLGPPQHQEFRITEGDGTYRLSAAQQYTVSASATQRWNTRAAATRTLRQQYVSVAESLGGTADLTVESYSFTQQRGGARLDIEYTVTYRGIERVLSNQLVTRLSNSPEVDLNESEADRITQQLRNLTVKEASVRYDQRGRTIDTAARVDLRDYDGVVFAALDVGESVDLERLNASDTLQSNASVGLAQFRTQFEAQQAAGLERRYTFAASLSRESDRAVAVEGELHSRSKNWSRYVAELNDRGIERSDVNYELHATSEGERIATNASLEVEGEDLLRGMTSELLNSTDGRDADETRRYVKAFREAGFRKARMDLSLADGRMRIEAGTAFENMTALRDAVATTEGGRSVDSVVGRTDNGTVTTHVRVEGAVAENATKAEVRKLPYVTDGTTIHMPDSWDRSFPTTNTTRAKDYLGLTGAASGLTGPGFGVVAALVALLAAALVAVRRRR